jgi:hypothetical protein
MDYENIKMVSQPKNINVKLYPHQLASIYNMENLELNNIIDRDIYTKETKIGINADLTGFGKTLSMIGLIARDKMEWDLDIPFVFEKIIPSSKNRVKTYFIERYEKLPTTLILLSPSIIGQWEQELGNTELTFKKILTHKNIEETDPFDFDVILVVPTMYNKLVAKYSDYAWKRFIFDEPGHLKVPSMREIHANFYWLITATPNSIMSMHGDCRTGFMKELITDNYSNNNFEQKFKDVIIKNDPEFIKLSFQMPETKHHNYECYNPMYNLVQNYVDSRIKSMIEGGDYQGAIEALGGGETSNIIDLVKKQKQNELYFVESKILLYTSRDEIDQLNMWKEKEKSIINQINEIENRYKNFLDEPCLICYEKLESPILEPNCQNVFCGNCFFQWLNKNNTCPLCRNKIDISKVVYINCKNEEEKNKNKNCNCENKLVQKKILTKPETVIDIIKSNKEGKFLIFSEYNNTFNNIYNILKLNNLKFAEIRGNSKSREKNLEMFKNGDVNIIFLNSSTNGAGINLQEATDIILYHDMTQAAESQIIGRANRIGRTMPLNVHHLKIIS